MPCPNRSGEKCTLLNERCWWNDPKNICGFKDVWDKIDDPNVLNSCPPIARSILMNLKNEVRDNWKIYAREGAPRGMRNMTGGPLEKQTREKLKNLLSPLGVTVSEKGKSFKISEDSRIIADCLIEKEGYPTTIVSVKERIDDMQMRETFGYAYLAKVRYGQKNIMVYMVSFKPVGDVMKLLEVLKQYIDGMYSLLGQPYIDEMVDKLGELYR